MSSQQSPFPGPIAPYNNPPIEPQYYQPSRFVITAISQGPTSTITTSVAHNYVVGQLVRLLIPLPYRAFEFNNRQAYVLSIPTTTQVVIDIDSTQFNAFDPSPTYAPTSPEIMAIGDINSSLENSSGRTNTATYIQGSFINISPQ